MRKKTFILDPRHTTGGSSYTTSVNIIHLPRTIGNTIRYYTLDTVGLPLILYLHKQRILRVCLFSEVAHVPMQVNVKGRIFVA